MAILIIKNLDFDMMIGNIHWIFTKNNLHHLSSRFIIKFFGHFDVCTVCSANEKIEYIYTYSEQLVVH